MHIETVNWIFSIGVGFAIMSLTYFGFSIIEKRRRRAHIVRRLYSEVHTAATRK